MAGARRPTKTNPRTAPRVAGAAIPPAALAGHRIVVFLQENKTTDFYFGGLAGWGAAVRHDRPLLSAPPNFDQPHDRSAWVHYAMGDYPGFDVQVDTDTVIPFYAWLAKEHTFCDHHFGLGSNSTSGHMLAVGGQTPTLKTRPSSAPTRPGTCPRFSPSRRPPGCRGRRSPIRTATRPSTTRI